MTIHPINLSLDTTRTLIAAQPANVDLLDFERDILAHWAVRWECATPAERKAMIDSLRITLNRE